MKNLDDILKNSLDGNGLDYSDAHWAAMEELLDDKSKRRGFFFRFRYLLIGLFIIGSGTAISLLLFKNNPNNSLTKASNPELALNQENENSISTETLQSNNASSTSQSALTKNKNSKGENQKLAFSDTFNEKRNVPITQQKTLPQKQRIQDKNAIKTNTTKAISRNISNIELKPIPIKTNESEDIKNDENVNAAKALPVVITAVAAIDKTAIRKPILLPFTAHTHKRGLSLLPNTLSTIFNTNLLDYKEPLINKALFGTFFIGGYMEYQNHQPIKNLAQLEQKKNEKLNASIEYGTELIIKEKNLVVKLGLGLRNIQSISNYTQQKDQWSYDTSLRLVRRNYLPSGGGGYIALIEKQIDSTFAGSIITNRCPNCETNFNYLTIPLTVQYELKRKRWIGFGELGLKSNVLLSASGLYSSLNKVDDLSTSQDAQKVFFSGRLGIGAKYQLANKWIIYGNYGYDLSLNSMIKSYNQRLNSNSVRFGIEYRL